MADRRKATPPKKSPRATTSVAKNGHQEEQGSQEQPQPQKAKRGARGIVPTSFSF